MTAPTVSVVIPTFNRARTIERAVRSVLQQTYRNLEVIIVDDGSTDNTREVIDGFGDARVRYIRSDTNRGANAARNLGIRVASSDFIAFQDSDDEWLSDKLSRQMREFESRGEKVGVVFGGFIRCYGSRVAYTPAGADAGDPEVFLDRLLGGNFIGTPTAVIRRSCLAAVGGFDESLPRLQDWELFIRLGKQCTFIAIDEPLVVSYHDADCISSNDLLYMDAIRTIAAKHADLFVRRHKQLAQHYYVLGKLYCRRGQMRQGIHYFISTLRRNPRRIYCYARLVVALFGARFYRLVFNGHD